MDRTAARPSPPGIAFAIAPLLSGVLAIILSVCGQLIAARRLAADTNSGHPSADQPFVHMLAITPSLCFSALAVLLYLFAAPGSRRHRRLAALGMVLGVIAAVLTLIDLPGGLAARFWIEPLPDER
ncbi:hypothetical protein ACT3SP_07755 [Brachybacterium sp. AOP43-C2-M15]|uniref:hypothetical protein n=1 Tax=Brachybacterium sp. AOP43-C2-M15 TaxID=3457661 RepID=UPI0040348957